jgi:tetratricopeptide (TPR) repeat protein
MRRMGGLDPHIGAIRYLLSVDPGDPAIPAMDAAARRKKTLEALRAFSLRGAGLRPVVLVIEDLHWIDTSSEEHVGFLVDSLAGVPIMLLLTYRVGYAPRFGTRSFHTTITLAALTPAETLVLAGRVLGVAGFPDELRAAMMEKAAGVPLFVEEVTKTLIDLGVLRREGDAYHMVKRLDEVSVPDTIQDIIMARLDRLGEDGKRTVQLAAVIGRQFLHRLLERITGLAGELEGLLRELKALEIIYEQGLLPEPAYIFKHAVIQDVAYHSLLVQRRKELHRAVALAIEELFPDRLGEHDGELAHHFFQAEAWQKAMEYSDLAGRRAAHSFANAEARNHYARAIDAAGRLVPPPEPGTLARLLGRSGGVLMVLGEYEASVAAYEQAVALAREAGEPALEAEMLTALGGVHNLNHRPERALEELNRALQVARRGDHRALEATCLATIVLTRTAGFGHLRETTEDTETVIRLAPEIGDPRGRAQALIYAGVSLQWRGRYERALAVLGEGIALARSVHAGFVEGLGTFHVANALLSQGRYEEALASYRRLHEYALAAGDRFALVRAANTIGAVHLELFDLDEAMRVSLESEELTQKVFPWPEPRAHALLKVAAAHLLRGEGELAREFLDRAGSLLDVDVWGRWRWQMALLRARGELALAQGRAEEAWRHAIASAELAARCDASKHLTQARRLQGQILVARDRLEEALEPLTEAVDLAERLGAVRDVWLKSVGLGGLLARRGRDAVAGRRHRRALAA